MAAGPYGGASGGRISRRGLRHGWQLGALIATIVLGSPTVGVEAAEPLPSSVESASPTASSPPSSPSAAASVSLSVLPESQTVELLVIDAPTVVSAALTIRLAVVNGPAEDVVVEAFVPRGLGTVQALPRPELAFGVLGTTVSWRLASVSDGDELQITTRADSGTSTEGDHIVTARIAQGPCTGDGCSGQALVTVVWYVAAVYLLDLRASPADVVPPATVAFSLHLNCMLPTHQLAAQVHLPPLLGAPAAISGGGSYDPAAHTIGWPQLACAITESFTLQIGTDIPPATYTVTAALQDGCPGCPPAQATLTIDAVPSTGPNPTAEPSATPTGAPPEPEPTLPPTDADPGACARP